MTEEKKNGALQTQEKKTPPREWEWETPHGLVRLSLDLVRRYFCADATEPEVMHFLAVCKYHKINPWLKEAYLIKYDKAQAAQIVVGKDFYNRRAQDFPTYKGHAAGIILQVKDANGRLSVERRAGAFYVEGEILLGGWAKVWRSDLLEPVEIEVQLKEYDKQQALWKTMKATLIRKVALSQCWREAYPKEFERLVDEAEIESSEPMTIEMPRSNADAASSARPAEADPGVEGAAATPADDFMARGYDPTMEEALEKEARAREIAEQKGEQAPPQEGLRQKAWRLIQERAAKEKLRPAQLLFQLTKKQAMADLSDADVQGLLVQL